MIRRERRGAKGSGGVSNVPHSTKAKVKSVTPQSPGWLNYMSMPRLKQSQYYAAEVKVFPDSTNVTLKTYKVDKREVQRKKEGVQIYDPIANLHSPLTVRFGLSNAIPDYDPDPYLQQQLEGVEKTDAHLRPIWTMKDVEEAPLRTRSVEKKEVANDHVVSLLNNIQEKCSARKDKKELVRMFDPKGTKKVTKDDVKGVFDVMGFSYAPEDPARVIAMAREKGTGDEVTTAEIYKLLNKGEAIDDFRGKESEAAIAATLDHAIRQKKKDNVMAILTNDIKRINKEVEGHTNRGFIKPDKARDILLASVKKWELADQSVVDQIIGEKTGPHGVDAQEVMEMIADNKRKMAMEKEQIKVKMASLDDEKAKLLDNYVNDNTIKASYYRLDQAVSKRNPVQMDLMAKYKDKDDLLKAMQAVIGEGNTYIKKSDIFELYKKATGKEKLSLEDKQKVFKFSENLRFREDDKKIEADDFADLVFGKIRTNARLKETERYIHPPPPEEERLGMEELGHSPLITRSKQEGIGHQLPEVRKNLEFPSHQSLNHTMASKDLRRPNNKDIRNLADRLGFTLNSKMNNSYEMFKFFDKDNDGLIKKQEFLNKMNDLGICNNDQAGRLFEALKPEAPRIHACIDFKTFTSGMQNITTGGSKSIETQNGPLATSLPPRRTILQPLDSRVFRKQMQDKQFTHDTRDLTQADRNTNMFMNTRDRFDRTAGHREACVKEDKERKERLLKEKVLNKSRILTMYEDIKSRTDWKQNQRESQNILVNQQRKQLYDEMCKLSSKI